MLRVGRGDGGALDWPGTVNALRSGLTWLALPAIALLASVPPVAAGDATRVAPPPGSGTTVYTVAAIGDSLTDTRVGGGRYMSLLHERCPQSRFDAYGVGGQRTDHMRWRLARDLFGQSPWPQPPRPAYTHVLILGGVNDLVASSRGYADTSSIRKNLSIMWREVRSRGATVVALTVPPWTNRGAALDVRIGATDRLNGWMFEQQRQGNVDQVVDIHARLLDVDGISLDPRYRRYPSDLIHWNEQGHRVVADALFREVFSDCR